MNDVMNSMDSFDDIVVGAGAAGAVIAARLSEDPERRVLLIEAGVDYPSDATLPAALLDANQPVMTGHNWHIPARVRDIGFLSTLSSAACALLSASMGDQARMLHSSMHGGIEGSMTNLSSFDYNVGKVVGGSTAINGGLVLRGTREDYDEWSQFSEGGWNWERVERAFQALEASEGNSGSVPVQDVRLEELTRIQSAFVQSCRANGFALLDPVVEVPARGVTLVRKAIRNGQRMSSARTHLLSARARPNLTILAQTHVDRLLWAGSSTTCQGVEVITAGKRRSFRCARVILSAGTLNTPAILMRSGLGPSAVLDNARVPIRLALPGVGSNLADHAVVGLWAVPKAGASQLGEVTHQTFLRHDSAARSDLHLYMLGGINTNSFPMLRKALGSELGIALAPCIMKPQSRGRCRILSSDPMAPPDVVVNCLADPEDARLIKEGVRLAWRILQDPALRQHVDRVLTWNNSLVNRDSSLESAIATFVRPGWHAVGTARMGLAQDPDAVVDAHGKVHGIEQLWIVDASIMPTVPSVPTALSCMMLAEELAAELRTH